MNSCNTAVVDIGGTNIKYGFLPAGAQTPQFTKEAPTNAHLGGTALMETVQALLRALPAFERIGVSTCGQVDRQTGGIRYATDNVPRYTGTPVRSLLEEAFGVPVAVENDVNAAALGEAHFGAGRGCQHFLCLTYSTGIGGAAILNGELYTGFHGAAGEFGHIVTHAGGRKCTCGGEGCYETYASTRALTREAESLLGHPVNGRELFALLHHGNQAIVQLVDSWIGEIAVGLAGLAYSLDPERIVLGGGIMKEPYLLPRLKQALDARLMPSYRDIALVPAQLGNTAGLMGAYWAAAQLTGEKNGAGSLL